MFLLHSKPLNEIQKVEVRIKNAEKYLVHAQNDLREVKERQKKTKQMLSDKKIINFDTIVQWMPDVKLDGLTMVLHSTPLKQVDKDPEKMSILEQRNYNIVLPGAAVPCNQMYSGRCWMFAGLNIFRRILINQYKLKPTFEFSQSYLFFWHYFEQYNDMLNLFYYKKNLTPVERAEWLDKPLHDGGNWIIFRRLVRKYGVVPKNMYRESWPSSHSSEMNSILCHLLQNDIQHCSTLTDVKEFDKFRNERLKQVLHILCSCMGKPPMSNEFSSTLETLEHKTIKFNGTAISTFNRNINASFDIDQHIQVIHDPRKKAKDLTWYTTQHQSLYDTPELFFNVKDMNQICAAVTQSIQIGRGVWFACNMNEDVCPQLQGMVKGLYRPDKFIPKENNLTMEKVDRMNWGRAHCNHAMLIVGVEFEQDEVKAFQIENSWGATGPGHGFYKMTVDWFHEHAYTVVIHRDILLKSGIDITEHPEKITEYPYYDIFG